MDFLSVRDIAVAPNGQGGAIVVGYVDLDSKGAVQVRLVINGRKGHNSITLQEIETALLQQGR